MYGGIRTLVTRQRRYIETRNFQRWKAAEKRYKSITFEQEKNAFSHRHNRHIVQKRLENSLFSAFFRFFCLKPSNPARPDKYSGSPIPWAIHRYQDIQLHSTRSAFCIDFYNPCDSKPMCRGIRQAKLSRLHSMTTRRRL